jgi:hypothetical protein
MDHPLIVSRRRLGDQPVVGGTIGGRTLTVYMPPDATDPTIAEVENAVKTLLEQGVIIFSLN